MVTTNAFEAAARARKVAKLLAVVPFPRDRVGIEASAAALSVASPRDRHWLAQLAGVSVPSDTTWTALVEAVRARHPGVSAVRTNRAIIAKMEGSASI
jgi:hypothetical protein